METFRRIRAIPTTYRGVLMKSKLEAKVAETLDGLGIPWVYEPPYPGTTKPRVYWIPGVRGSGYLPDFRLWPERRDPWFVEVKPTGIYDERHPDPDDLKTAVERLLIVRHAEPKATLILWVADPHDADMGRVLVNIPGAGPHGWAERAAIPYLTGAVRAYR